MANIGEPEKSAIFAEENFVVDAQIFLHNLMEEKGLSRADLARAMGVTRARVTQIFSDDCTNFTVRLLARAAHALGETVSIDKKSNRKRPSERLTVINPEDIESFWNIKATLNDVRKLMPCNDQTPTRLINFDYPSQEWEAA